MIIDEQIALFYRRLRESQTNSRITPEEALEYINGSRRSLAADIKFYQVEDRITAAGGETYWTMRDDFLEPIAARDWATCNGYPIIIKSKAEWATITNGTILPVLPAQERWGMVDGKQFYTYPAAQSGDVFRWRGCGIPPALPAVSGPDVYTDDIEAELIVLDAVMDALEDLNREPGPRLEKKYNELKKMVKRRARPRGPRLEHAPDNVWPL